MSNATFFAWSLLVSGLLVLVFYLFSRRSGDTLVQKLVVSLGLLFFGAVITTDATRWFATTTAPAWTGTLRDGFPLVMGLFFLTLYPSREHKGLSTPQFFGVVAILFGVAILGLDFVHGGRAV
jgi:hypothetical membrane protein